MTQDRSVDRDPEQDEWKKAEEGQVNPISALPEGARGRRGRTPREGTMGAVARHSARPEVSRTPSSHQHTQRPGEEEMDRSVNVDTAAAVVGIVRAGVSPTGRWEGVRTEGQRGVSSGGDVGAMDEPAVDIREKKKPTNGASTSAGGNTITTVVDMRKDSQSQTQHVSKSNEASQGEGSVHRQNVDSTPGNRNSPVDRTVSPVLWRHNPYTGSPSALGVEVTSTGVRQSPSITAPTSVASTSLTVAIKTNPAVRNSPSTVRRSGTSPSVVVSPQSNFSISNNNSTSFVDRAACISGGCGTPSYEGGRACVSNDPATRGAAWDDDEDGFCGPPSSTPSMYEVLSCEMQQHIQPQLQQHSVWPTRHRANSAFCTTQRGVFSASLSACAAASLSTSPSSMSPVSRACGMRQRSLSLLSSQSSPMMRRSLVDPVGLLFTPSVSYWDAMQSPTTALLDECGNLLSSHSSTTNNNNNNNHVSSDIGRRFSTGSMPSPTCIVHNIVPALVSPTLPATAGSTTGGGLDNTNVVYNSTSSPHPSSLHRGVHDGSVASITSWSAAQTSGHTMHCRGDIYSEAYDEGCGSEMHADDDECEIEPYNATLRPNDLTGRYRENRVGVVRTKLTQESLRGNNKASKRGGIMTASDDIGTGPLTVLPLLPETLPQHSKPLEPTQKDEKGNETEHTFEEGEGKAEEQQLQPQHRQHVGMIPLISSCELEEMMLKNPREEVMCQEGFYFSVYDANIREHYMIESSKIVATRGAVRYVASHEQYGTHSRFRFQLCKRYLKGRCTQKMDCQYIHSQYVPAATLVHINENIIGNATLDGRGLSAEVLRGGRNTHGYATLPPGIDFYVYPPNQESSVPQIIPSGMILETAGALNVYSLITHFVKTSTSGGGKSNSINNNNKEGSDTTTTDTLITPTNQTVTATSIKARHCAHFQFNKMCNLGSSCDFIHSLVPYVQGLQCLSQDPIHATTVVTQHRVLRSNKTSPPVPYPAASGGAPSYPVEILHRSPHPQRLQAEHVPTHTNGLPNAITYHQNMHLTQFQVLMQAPPPPQLNAYNTAGGYPPAEYAMPTHPTLRGLPHQHETLTMVSPHGQYFALPY